MFGNNIKMVYRCEFCNYETKYDNNKYVHEKTQKHIRNCNKAANLNPVYSTIFHNIPIEDSNLEQKKVNRDRYICQMCGLSYSTVSNLLKHRHKCLQQCNKNLITKLEQKNELLKLENQNKLLLEQINSLQKEYILIKKEKEDKINMLEKENEYHKQLIVSAGNMIQSSMSTLNYLILNCNNAPLLEPLKDYSILEDKSKFIKNIIYYHKENKLDQYLGNFLVKHYKTKDPKKQSNWNSDTSRLTYINRELVNNIPNWVIDKKGVKMTGTIIDPLLDYVKTISQEYMSKLKEKIDMEDNNEKQNNILIKMTCLSEIIKDINNKVISKGINQYLAPHFYFDKNNVLTIKDI